MMPRLAVRPSPLRSIPGERIIRESAAYWRQINAMQKKLTITIDQRVYDGLHTVVGRRRTVDSASLWYGQT